MKTSVLKTFVQEYHVRKSVGKRMPFFATHSAAIGKLIAFLQTVNTDEVVGEKAIELYQLALQVIKAETHKSLTLDIFLKIFSRISGDYYRAQREAITAGSKLSLQRPAASPLTPSTSASMSPASSSSSSSASPLIKQTLKIDVFAPPHLELDHIHYANLRLS